MSDEVQVTPELLATLEEASRNATPGPWRYVGGAIFGRAHGGPSSPHYPPIARIGEVVSSCAECSTWRDRAYNGRHIAAASPAIVLALVKRIRELESIVGRRGTQVPELREPTFRT